MSVILDVRPSGYSDAARTLGGEVAEGVQSVWWGVASALDGTYGMAGSDVVGAQWGGSYDVAASASLGATTDVVNGCFRLAALLEQTGINYEGAEAASTPGVSAGRLHARWASARASSMGDVEPSVGLGLSAPAGWSLLQHAIGYLWPDGHQDLLRRAAVAWHRGGNQVSVLMADVDRAVIALREQRAPEVDDAVTVVGAMRGHLADLAADYHRIAEACSEYADHLDQAHHAIIEELKSFGKWTAGIEGAGAALALLSLGTSEAVAQAAEAAEISRAAAAVRSIIETLLTVTRGLRAGLDAAVTRLGALSAKLAPIMSRQLEEVRLAMAGDRGELVFSRKLARQTGEGLAPVTVEGAAVARLDEAAHVGPASDTWANLRSLGRHFTAHGSDFGVYSEESYAREAALFFQRAKREKLPMKVDDADDTIRFYEPESNTFGAYRLDGRTRTYFKPSAGEAYWDTQIGALTNG